MCYFPKLRPNKKYVPNKKNQNNPPQAKDPRVLKVPVACGNCQQCRKQIARNWQVRLMEDIKVNTNAKLLALTFSNEEYEKLTQNIKAKGYLRDNLVATRAMHLFRENWRKEFKQSPRHWFITELGHNGTENIHLHGIIWTNESYETIRRKWKYGYIWPRESEEKKTYVNARTINYHIKYIHKIDSDHKYYKPIILCSPGIGKAYMKNNDYNKYKGKDTITHYRTESGHKVTLPSYYRNNIYNDEEREQLWLNLLDKNIRYVNGLKFDVSKSEEKYLKALKEAQNKSNELGYRNDQIDWTVKKYEEELRDMKHNKRVKNNNNNNYKNGKYIYKSVKFETDGETIILNDQTWLITSQGLIHIE